MRRALAAAVCLALVGCGSSAPTPAPTTASGPRAVTAAEADRLAIARFTNYRARGLHFRTSVASSGGPLAVSGDVDFRGKVGTAVISGAGSAFVVQWTATTLAAWPSTATSPPRTPPATPAGRRALAPTGSDVDALLALLLLLGLDRPDNAQLLRRNGATWLRRDTVGGHRVDVIRGPSAAGSTASAPVVYWVDATGHLWRVDATFGATGAATSIVLDTAGYVPFTRSSQLAG